MRGVCRTTRLRVSYHSTCLLRESTEYRRSTRSAAIRWRRPAPSARPDRPRRSRRCRSGDTPASTCSRKRWMRLRKVSSKSRMPPKTGLVVDGLLQIAGRIERHLAVHVVDDEAPIDAGHFAALHGVAALDVVAAGQVADRAVLEAHVEDGRGPDGAARRLGGEAVHGLDVAAEVAHDVDGVGVQRLEVEVGRDFRAGS